ncbi:hypothetical protein KM043_015561 [Ampulex compressa]|nr:hypothetical protein KM043_015561 [Ampulex compressa]
MYKFTVLLVLCLAAVGYSLPANQIVGGSDAADGVYPYQVSLRLRNRHFCGASIISERYILTAAHCVASIKPSLYSRVTVNVGTNQLNTTGTAYGVESIVYHERFDSFFLNDDVAVIRVDSDIKFNSKVQRIGLDTDDITKVGQAALVTGWGRLSYPGIIPNNLQQLFVKIFDQKQCKALHWRVRQTHICALSKRGEGACHGDSGGPLVAGGVQVGIVSFGDPCATGSPDVYTRVSSYRHWIREHITDY